MMVPLVGDETDALLRGQPAEPITDPRDIQLLRLVAKATPIRTIARELGIGERATQKRLAALRERFNVGTTAELSVLLAARGLGGATEEEGVDEAGLDP